jgi:2-C-methyl-D-erythritol 4-phosphate cytidylyltransferase
MGAIKVNTVAIVLAGGSGKRMGTAIPKQYLMLKEKPILYYSLKAFEDSSVDEIILVASENDIDFCRNEIVNKYGLKKLVSIVSGGSERYLSVYNGLKAAKEADYVLIHDGARPFITTAIIESSIIDVVKYKACIVGVPSKDTVKIVNSNNVVISTPDRNNVWNIQTPQSFSYDLIYNAYEEVMKYLYKEGNNFNEIEAEYSCCKVNAVRDIKITDDAMVVEMTLKYPIHVTLGSYTNIKITTIDDLKLGEALIESE